MRKKNIRSWKQKPAWLSFAVLMLILALGLSACAGGATQGATVTETQSSAMMDEKPTEAMVEATQADRMMESTQEPLMGAETQEPMLEATAGPMLEDGESSKEEMMSSPDWFSVALKDVNSGESISLQGFDGKVVLVETMAVWCSNCLQQQRQVKALHELLGERDDLVSLALDIDPNENADDLKGFVDRNGFDWNYAVAPAEVARELGNLYGAQFLNPPSTPMLIVDRHGEVHPLPFGIKDAQTLKEALDPFLAENM